MKNVTKCLNPLHTLILTAVFGMVLGVAQPSVAGEKATGKTLVFESGASSKDAGKLVVAGTSSLHDWEVVTEAIVGTLEITLTGDADGQLVLAPDGSVKATVAVPVKTLDSGKGGMDKKMYKALEAKKHEEAAFVLESLKPEEEKTEEGGLKVEATGKLTITDKTRWVRFPAVIKWDAKTEAINVTGEVDLLMTDFGIDPPTALLGTLKTGNAVTVSFEWTPKLK